MWTLLLVAFIAYKSLIYSLLPQLTTTTMRSRHYPVSPPLSSGHGSPYLDSGFYTMAPPMPNVPLPPCPDHYHAQPSSHHRTYLLSPHITSRHSSPTLLGGLVTPPPSPPRVHPVLSAASTVVRYDFARGPETIRMSSSSQYLFFPSDDPASSSSASLLYVCCEATGHTITVHGNGAVTCLDLMVQLHRFFEGEMRREEWRGVGGAMRSAMKEAYERRTGFAYSGSARMKRVDYLLGRTTFKRIVPQDGESMWLLQTC